MAQTAPVDVPEGIPTGFIRLQDSFNHTQQTMLLLKTMGENTSELEEDLILKIKQLGFITTTTRTTPTRVVPVF